MRTDIFSLPLQLHQIRRLIIPVLALLLVHFTIYKKLPFQEGYSFPLLSYILITFIGFIICEVNARVHQHLSKKWPLSERNLKRLSLQILGGMLGTALVFTPLTLLINQVWFGIPFEWVHFLAFLLLMLGISFLENTIFLLVDFYLLSRQLAAEKTHNLSVKEKEQLSATLLVKSGPRTLRIAVEEIAYFFSKGGIVTLVKTDGQKIITEFEALHELEQKFTTLFRINRQYLIHPQAIKSVKEVENRKLEVDLTPLFNGKIDPVIISRYKRNAFRDWLER
ncbi:MAG: LytTR family DNA-binding domain-containing protein [Saprospiraceae bacterium]